MEDKFSAGIVAIALGGLIALIPILIFPVCNGMFELSNGKSLFMKCHWTAMAELLVGILIIFDGILMVGFKKHETRIALSIMLFLLGLTALLMSTVMIGMCETPTMPCRVGTGPALIVVSITTMVMGLGNIVSASISHEERFAIKYGKTKVNNFDNFTEKS